MEKRDSIISVITNPLGFFALSLLIVEGFLTVIIVGSGKDFPQWAKVVGMFLTSISFFLVVGLVTLLVWYKPKHLTFGGKEWNENEQFGASNNPKTKLEEQKLPATQAETYTITNETGEKN